ncbi:unnamed protein product [Fusarium fujikuroi]|uniref:Integral membrane protein n=1 Tax=Fusarium fujikuroi TaxID=5127 RepID=A0A9Q9RE27_FUSFU|nr:unnamed protein product [Fusarium fujikuroi]
MASVQPPNPLPPDQNVGPILPGISGTCLALVIITTSVRIWVRTALRSSGWDDYTIVLVTLLGVARFGVQVGQVSIGNGRHRWFIEPEDYVQNNKLGWVAQILLFASICLLKISILLLLLRIKDSRRVRYAAWGIMAGLVVTNFGCIIILLSECRPISAYWTGVGECWNPRIRIYYIYATIAFSILTDLICSLLPVFVIWNTSLPLKTEISVWALMSLGLVATGFGIARATSLGVVTSDLSWVYAITAIWSNLELYLGIVGANLALSRSIFAYFFREGGTTKGSSYGGMPRSTSASRNLRVPSSSGFRSGQSRIQSRDQDSEISLVQTTKKQPSTWYTEEGTAFTNGQRQSTAIYMKIVHHEPLGVTVGIILWNAPFPMALELGGKNPVIIFDDCDLNKAVTETAESILQNTGQGCIVCSRVYVQEGVCDRLAAAYRGAMEARTKAFGDVDDPKTRFGPLADKLQYDQVKRIVRINCISGLFLITPFDGCKELRRECGLFGLTSWIETKTVMINMTWEGEHICS